MTPVRHGHSDVSYEVSDRHKRDGLLQLSEDVWQKGWQDGYERFVQVYDRLLDSRLGPAESTELIRAIGENSDDPHRPDPRPEGQVEDCEARIEERGAQVGEVHIDSGRSAWNPRVRRPDWNG